MYTGGLPPIEGVELRVAASCHRLSGSGLSRPPILIGRLITTRSCHNHGLLWHPIQDILPLTGCGSDWGAKLWKGNKLGV